VRQKLSGVVTGCSASDAMPRDRIRLRAMITLARGDSHVPPVVLTNSLWSDAGLAM
jgi:hypothetical protein